MTQEALIAKLKETKFRKVKAKMIVEAIEKGISERGNHKIAKTSSIPLQLTAYYMRTPIATISIVNGSIDLKYVDAGEFDNTVATIRQRKDLSTAVIELVTTAMTAVTTC